MDSMKIAIASSDGIVVNNHFGRARSFYIYQVQSEKIIFLETRQVSPVCDCGNHDEIKLNENLSRVSDCDYLLVSRIGDGARIAAANMGIDAYEIPGIIENSINKLIQYIKIQNLFK